MDGPVFREWGGCSGKFFSPPQSKYLWAYNFSDHHESLSSRIRNFILTSWHFLVGLLEYQRVNVLDDNSLLSICSLWWIKYVWSDNHTTFTSHWSLHVNIVDFWIATPAIEIVSLVETSMFEKSYFTVFDWLMYRGLRSPIPLYLTDRYINFWVEKSYLTVLDWLTSISGLEKACNDEQIKHFSVVSKRYMKWWTDHMLIVTKYQHPSLIFIVRLYQPIWTNTFSTLEVGLQEMSEKYLFS